MSIDESEYGDLAWCDQVGESWGGPAAARDDERCWPLPGVERAGKPGLIMLTRSPAAIRSLGHLHLVPVGLGAGWRCAPLEVWPVVSRYVFGLCLQPHNRSCAVGE